MTQETAGAYLSLKDVAEQAAMSYAAVKRDIENGRLAACKIGRKYFVSSSDAAAYCRNKKENQVVDGYTVKEILEIIPVSYAFVIGLIRQGNLPAYKSGRRYMIKKEDFRHFIDNNKAF